MSAAPTLGAIADRMTGILGRVDALSLSGADVASVRRLAAASDAVFEAAVRASLTAPSAGQGAPGTTDDQADESKASRVEASLVSHQGA